MNELLAQLDALDAKVDAILANADLTAEQVAEHDKLLAERAKLLGAIDREKGKQAREAERAKLKAEADAASAAILARAATPAGRATEADVPNPADVPAQRGEFRLPATAKRFGSLSFFKGTSNGQSADARAYRFGMWGLAQLSMQMPNRYRFKQAIEFYDQQFGIAHGSNNSSGVHNLVPEEFGMDMIDLREQYGLVRRLFKKVPMTSDTRTDPRRQGGLTAYFTGENAAGTESNMNWDNVDLNAKNLMVLGRMSNQVNADAAINFGDTLMGEIIYAFTNKEDLCGLIGDGTSTYGKIQGVISKLQDCDGAGTDSYGCPFATGNLFSEFVLGDFDKVVGRLPQYADTPDACWVMHRSFYYETVEKLIQASGGVPAAEVREGNRRPRPLFKGYPVEFSQVMPSTDANSQVAALLGDFKLAGCFGDRQQDEIVFSEHATVGGESVFERNQVAIRGTERFDINVHDVGTASVGGPVVGLQSAAA